MRFPMFIDDSIFAFLSAPSSGVDSTTRARRLRGGDRAQQSSDIEYERDAPVRQDGRSRRDRLRGEWRPERLHHRLDFTHQRVDLETGAHAAVLEHDNGTAFVLPVPGAEATPEVKVG